MNAEKNIYSNSHYYAVYSYPPYNSSLDAPCLILLHGFMGSSHVFDPLITFLRKEFHILAIDLLGHGKTTGTDDPLRYDVHKQIVDLHKIVTHPTLAKTDKVFMYGYSMGGRLAMRFAITYPKLLDHLILESASPGIILKEDRINRYELDNKRADNIITDFGAFLRDWEQAPIFQNPAKTANENEIKAYRKIQKKQTPSYMAACLKGFSPAIQSPVYEDLKKLTLPISLTAGEYDNKYSQLYRQLYQDIPQSNAYIVSDAAHRVHLDQTKQLAEILKSLK